MRKKSVEEILKIYLESAEITKNALMSGDYKKCNKEGAKLLKCFKQFEVDKDYGFNCIDSLLLCENEIVRTDAATYCLALNYRVEDAEKILQEIASDKSNGIFGFNAEMTLKVWKEQGYLKIY